MEQPKGAFKKIDSFYYEPNRPLAHGAFGVVYKAIDERTMSEVAVKVIPAIKLESEQEYNLFMREIDVLRKLKGENLVQFHNVSRTPNNLYIFTDYCDGGDLDKKIKSKYLFTEEEACSILKQIANAFVTIENLSIVNSKGQKVTMMHRDIKPANILFHQGKIKVADFGFARFIDEADKNKKDNYTLLGTPVYMAPQILNDECYSPKCDIWSVGMLFYELLFGKLPWNGYSVPSLYNNIQNKPLSFPKQVRDETMDLLSRMLMIKEEDRLSWREVFKHPALIKMEVVQEPEEQGEVGRDSYIKQSTRNFNPRFIEKPVFQEIEEPEEEPEQESLSKHSVRNFTTRSLEQSPFHKFNPYAKQTMTSPFNKLYTLDETPKMISRKSSKC
jgi:serine/threonine-protein kinase ULK/ATG1